jgi:hypothetical protein
MREHESEQQAAAREEPGVREHEQSNGQQQERSRECENKSNQPTPWDEPLQETSQGCKNTGQNNEQQQERSRECKNKSNQPTPGDEPLHAQTSGCKNTSQNNAQQQESIIMEHNIINWILILILHQQINKPRLFIKHKDVPIL